MAVGIGTTLIMSAPIYLVSQIPHIFNVLLTTIGFVDEENLNCASSMPFDCHFLRMPIFQNVFGLL